MKKSWLFYICLLLTANTLNSQVVLEVNGNIDFEASFMSENTHYFYNELHKNAAGFHIDVPEINLVGKLKLAKNWAINSRWQTVRQFGKRPGIAKDLMDYNSSIHQLNVEWKSIKIPLKIIGGRFMNGYGSYTKKQLSYERNFISRPLFYSFYVNASDVAGVAPSLGENLSFRKGMIKDWGIIPFYYGAYSNGIKMVYGNQAETNYSLAIVSGTPNKLDLRSSTFSPTVVFHIGKQVNYATSIGWSVMHGAYMNKSSSNDVANIRKYTETTTGIDFKYGKVFFELSGELNVYYFRAPTVFLNNEILMIDNKISHFLGISPFIDLKYEFSVLPSLFVAARIDAAFHQNLSPGWTYEDQWEDDIFAISFASGYKVSQFLELRINASWQIHFEEPEPIDRSGLRVIAVFKL